MGCDICRAQRALHSYLRPGDHLVYFPIFCLAFSISKLFYSITAYVDVFLGFPLAFDVIMVLEYELLYYYHLSERAPQVILTIYNSV